jgi:hypothetical protein
LGSTDINYRARNAAAGALYREDNTVRTGTSNGGPLAGTPITLTATAVPDPATLSLPAPGYRDRRCPRLGRAVDCRATS